MPEDGGFWSTYSIELIALILTVAGGFGGLSYQIGRRSRDLDTVKAEVAAVSRFAHEHDAKCEVRNKETDTRLAEGSTKMALLGASQERMEADIREIRDHLLPKKD